MEYRVTWEIDVEADSPRQAAEKARAAQVRPGTIATVFTVAPRVDPRGIRGLVADEVQIDLDDQRDRGPWSIDTAP
jgi:hypothetical protein